MAAYILCDTPARDQMLPFTHTRPLADCRAGILTIREKWEHRLKTATSTLTAAYLAERYPMKPDGEDNFLINGALLPDAALLEAMARLQAGEQLVSGDDWLMTRSSVASAPGAQGGRPVAYPHPFTLLRHPWELWQKNDRLLREDFFMLTQGRSSAPLPSSNTVLSPENIFVEQGASVSCAVLNASTGPIYIGRGATILEGAVIRGPFALLDGATVKMGAAIYGATTVGPFSVAGGEIKNSILSGYSNKSHYGYLGDAVLGEWCNLGAGTCCSNLKNNLMTVRVFNEASGQFAEAGKKCGMMMGDFSRTGIGTLLNTGTVIGVSCHVFGGGLPPVWLPSFSWGGAAGLTEYKLPEALRDAAAWKQLKGKSLGDDEKAILNRVFNHTLSHRKQFIKS
jgi:UDP-N-acetylglucosamine diphosphorylase/glucosamine-1-phosphate N-acetyltransferase